MLPVVGCRCLLQQIVFIYRIHMQHCFDLSYCFRIISILHHDITICAASIQGIEISVVHKGQALTPDVRKAHAGIHTLYDLFPALLILCQPKKAISVSINHISVLIGGSIGSDAAFLDHRYAPGWTIPAKLIKL